MTERLIESRVIRRSDHGRVHPAARFLLSLIFVVSGVSKLMNFDASLQYMSSTLLPPSEILLGAAIALELVGGLMLMFGFMERWVAWTLALYLVPVTLIFHTNFTEQDQVVNFLKNLAIIGGLLQTAVLNRSIRVLRTVEPGYEQPISGTTGTSGPRKSA